MQLVPAFQILWKSGKGYVVANWKVQSCILCIEIILTNLQGYRRVVSSFIYQGGQTGDIMDTYVHVHAASGATPTFYYTQRMFSQQAYCH